VFEVDLNNGVFREIDLSKPVYCAACGKEIHGNTHDVDISQSVIDVHTSGFAFCKSCKRAFTKWASPKIDEYEKKLAVEFVCKDIGNVRKGKTVYK